MGGENKNMKLINRRKSKKMREREVPLPAAFAHGILICIMLLAGGCWAYYSMSIEVPLGTIQAAGYGVHARIISGGDVVAEHDYASVTDGDSFVMELAAGVEYKVELTGLGEASWNGGYCIVSAGDNARYTERIYPDSTLCFQLMIRGEESGKVVFLPYWGYYPKEVLEEADADDSGKNIYVLDDGSYSIIDDCIVKINGQYVVSAGDFMVSPGDSTVQIKSNVE